MLQRILASALGAGLAVGLLVAVLQHVTLVPLILHAEKYEDGTLTVPRAARMSEAICGAVAPGCRASRSSGLQDRMPTDIGAQVNTALPAMISPAQAHEAKAAAAPAKDESPWRAVLTFLATTLTAIGFAMLLTGAYAVSGRQVDAREGLLWGLAGFTAFALAPAFGLPPELPGAAAAELTGRQIWWIGTVAATAAGIGLLVFMRRSWAIWAVALAIALLVAPHLIGAPHPREGAGPVPPELAATFAARSIGVNAVLWALLGLATGALYARFGRSSAA